MNVMLVGLLLGFFIGVGAALVWAAGGPPAVQTRTEHQLPAEVQAVLHRLDHGAEHVRALMRDVLRGQK